MKIHEKYLDEKTDIDKTTKHIIKETREFIDDIKISRNKYQAQKIPGVISSFIDEHIKNLKSLQRKLPY